MQIKSDLKGKKKIKDCFRNFLLFIEHEMAGDFWLKVLCEKYFWV